MNRSAVDFRHGGGRRDGGDYLVIWQRTHADDHFSVENSGWLALDIRKIHRNIPALFDMPDRHICGYQLRLKGKAAPDKKAHKIIAPKMLDARIFAGHDAVFIDPVFRNIICDIRAGGYFFQKARADIADFEYRARARVALSEKQEIIGEILRQNAEVRLSISRTHARSVAGYFALSYKLSYIARTHRRIVHFICLQSGAGYRGIRSENLIL